MEKTFSSSDVVVLIRELQVETERRRTQRRWVIGSVVALACLVVCAELYLSLSKGRRPDVAAIGPMLAMIGISVGLTPKLRELSQKAASLRDPRLAPFLVEILDSQDASVIPHAVDALKASLPAVGRQEDVRFDPRQMRILASQVAQTEDADFAEACLEAIQAVGSPEQIPALEAVTHGQLRLGGAARDRVTSRALMVLGHIRMREAQRIISLGQADSDSAVEAQSERLRLNG